VDLDPQGNMTYAMAADPAGPTSLDMMLNGTDALLVIQQGDQGDIIPASTDLIRSNTLLNLPTREYRLRESLKPIRKAYDYIVIDTPPALNILTINAMTAATGLVIPTQADIFSIHGIGQLYDTIQATRNHSNPDLAIIGILMTRHNPRTILSRDLEKTMRDIAKKLDTKIFKTTIRECIALREAQILQKDIFTYSPRSNAAKDYAALVGEITKGAKHAKETKV